MESSRNFIQQLIKDLTNRMDIITSQLRIIFDFVDKFKHKRHLIIYSYLLGYYAAKGNDNFNENILFDSLEIFNKSLTRKTELSNLIIAISLSINKKDEEEEEKKQAEQQQNENDNAPRIDITETMLSNDPFTVYRDLFGDTVIEKPLSGTIINKLAKINSKNIQNNNNNNNNNINNNIDNNNKNKIEKKNTNLSEIKENANDNDNLNNKKNKNDNNIDEEGNNKNKSNIVKRDYSPNIPRNKIKMKLPEDNIHRKNNYNNQTFNTISNRANISNNNRIPKKMENLPGIQSKNSKKIIKCFICSQNFNENDKHNYKLNCRCIIHHKCFNNYIKNAIENQEIPILCPKCNKEINSECIYKSLNVIGDSNLIKQYENLYLDIYVKNYERNNNNGIVYYCCPTPGCKKYIPCKNNEIKLSCPKCRKEYCLKCYKPWHKNKNCEDFSFQSSINNAKQLNKEFYDIYTNDQYKQCPKCKALMIKEEGTNKILCVCGNIYCYKCGKSIIESHDCP